MSMWMAMTALVIITTHYFVIWITLFYLYSCMIDRVLLSQNLCDFFQCNYLISCSNVSTHREFTYRKSPDMKIVDFINFIQI